MQVLRRGKPSIRALHALVSIRSLPRDPLAEVPIGQCLQRATALSVGRREAVIVHEGMEAVAPAVPHVPDEGALAKKLAVHPEEVVAQPRLNRLGGPPASRRGDQELTFRRRRPVPAICGGEQLAQPIRRRPLAADCG